MLVGADQARLLEHVVFDPLKQRVQFFRLQNGRYELVPLEEGHIFRSEVLPGFWLDVRLILLSFWITGRGEWESRNRRTLR